MAKGTIKQRIALDGGEDIRKELAELGRVGEVAFAKLKKAAKDAEIPSSFGKNLDALKKSFTEVGTAGTKISTSFAGVKKSFNELDGAFNTVIRRVGLFTAAMAGVVFAFERAASASAKWADDLIDNAAKANIGVQEYQRLSAVAKLAGVSAEGLANSFKILNKQLQTNGDAASLASKGLVPVKDAATRIKEGLDESGIAVTRFGETFDETKDKALGLTQALKLFGVTNIDAFKALPNEQKLLALAGGFNSIGDETLRTTALTKIFGRGALELVPLLAMGEEGIRKVFGRLKELGLELDEGSIKGLADLADEMDILGFAGTQLRNQLVALFAPDLIKGSQSFLKELAKNREAIVRWVTYIKDEAIGIVGDFFSALDGGTGSGKRPWILDWVKAAREFGTTLKDVIEKYVIPAFNKFQEGLAYLAEKINETFGTKLTGKELGIILLLLKLSGVLGVIVPAVTLVASSVGLLISVFRGGVASLNLFLGALRLIGSGLLGLVRSTTVGQTILAGLRTALMSVVGAAGFVTGALTGAAKTLLGVFQGIGGGVGAALRGVVTSVGAILGRLAPTIVGLFSGIGAQIGQAFSGLGGLLLRSLAGLLPAARVIVAGIAFAFGGLPGLILTALVAAGAAIYTYWDEITGAAKAARDYVAGLWSSVDFGAIWDTQTVSTAWARISEILGSGLDVVWSSIVAAGEATWAAVVKSAETAWGLVQAAADKTWNAIQEAAATVGSVISDRLSSAFDGLLQAWNAVAPAIQAGIEKLGTLLSGLVSSIARGAAQVAGALGFDTGTAFSTEEIAAFREEIARLKADATDAVTRIRAEFANLGIAAGLISAAGEIKVGLFDKLKADAVAAKDAIVATFQGIGALIAAPAAAAEATGAEGPTGVNPFAMLEQQATEAFLRIKDAATTALTEVTSFLTSLTIDWTPITAAADITWQTIKDKAVETAEFIRTTFAGLTIDWNGLLNGLQAVVDAIRAPIEGIGQAVNDAASTVADASARMVQSFLDVERAARAAAQAAASVGSGGGSSSSGGFSDDGFARGGHIRGRGTSTSDSVPIWASVGEFMQRAKAVKFWGRSFMEAVNRMDHKAVQRMLSGQKLATGGMVARPTFKLGLPAFNMGGLLDSLTAGMAMPSIRMPAMATAPALGGGATVNLTIGNERIELPTTESAAEQLARAAARRRMTSGGRKPSWMG
jgi:hypothetical protein